MNTANTYLEHTIQCKNFAKKNKCENFLKNSTDEKLLFMLYKTSTNAKL